MPRHLRVAGRPQVEQLIIPCRPHLSPWGENAWKLGRIVVVICFRSYKNVGIHHILLQLYRRGHRQTVAKFISYFSFSFPFLWPMNSDCFFTFLKGCKQITRTRDLMWSAKPKMMGASPLQKKLANL